MAVWGVDLSCIGCSHYKGLKKGLAVCDAYKDKIPYSILSGDWDHRKSFSGDHGIQFELIDSKSAFSEKDFWINVYRNNKAHWTKKEPSLLTKKAITKLGPFSDVLEIGSAAGIDTFELAKSSKKVTGIDIVPEAVKLAKKNLEKQSPAIKDKVTFEQGDVEKLRFKENTFDFVYSLSVLHSTNIKKSLSEVKRVLKSKGDAVIYVILKSGKEGIDEKLFVNTINDLFSVSNIEKSEVEDDGGDIHKISIAWLKNE